MATKHVGNKVGVVQCTGKISGCTEAMKRAAEQQDFWRLSIHIFNTIIELLLLYLNKRAELEWIGQLDMLVQKTNGSKKALLCAFTCFVVFASRCCSVLQLKRYRGSEGLQSLITHPGHSTPTRHSHSRFVLEKVFKNFTNLSNSSV